MINRTGEMGDPCGVPTSSERGSAVRPLKCRQTQRSVSVRLKLAFCMTCAVRVLVLAQGPSF